MVKTILQIRNELEQQALWTTCVEPSGREKSDDPECSDIGMCYLCIYFPYVFSAFTNHSYKLITSEII